MEQKKSVDPVNLYMTDAYHKNLEIYAQGFPIMLILQLSSFCNYECIMCKRQVLVKERTVTGFNNGHMSLELIKELTNQCKDKVGFLGFQFALYGEPMMNPEFLSIVEHIKSKNIKLQLVTNGSFLTSEMANSLIDLGLDKIKISFQGATKERYQFWRASKRYDEIVNNVKELVELRNSKKSKLFIQVGTSSCDDSEEELKDFISQWSSVVDNCYWNYSALTHVLDDPLIQGRIPYINHQAPLRKEKCKEPFKRMAAMWNGDVPPCVSVESNFCGNLYKSSIAEIWNGKEFRRARQTIIEKGNIITDFCSKCCVQPEPTKTYSHRYESKNGD